jgi:hypothetical protein
MNTLVAGHSCPSKDGQTGRHARAMSAVQHRLTIRAVSSHNLGFAMTFDLLSPLPVSECVRRLRATTDGMWAMAGSKPVLGSVGGKAVRLRKRNYYRHSSQVWLSGKFAEANGQTLFHGTVGLHPVVRLVLEYWVAAVLLGGGAVFVRTVRRLFAGDILGHRILSDYGSLSASWPPGVWLGLIVPPLLLGFGVILLVFGDRFSSDDPRFLIEFLARTIDAREVRRSL